MKLSGEAMAAITAVMIRAVRKASVTWSGFVAVDKPDTVGITANEASAAVRAMALLTPEAMLTSFGSTDPITVAVSGATNVVSPRPNSKAPGRTSVHQDTSGPIRLSRSRPI